MELQYTKNKKIRGKNSGEPLLPLLTTKLHKGNHKSTCYYNPRGVLEVGAAGEQSQDLAKIV